MVVGSFNKDHLADNVRITKEATIFEDDGKSPHDVKMVSYANWTMLTTNVGRFLDVVESIPDPAGGLSPDFPSELNAGATTPYRKTKFSYGPITGPDKWILTPIVWQRVLDANDNVKAETDFAFDNYGRMTSARKLFSPMSAPQAVSQDDLLTTFTYDD